MARGDPVNVVPGPPPGNYHCGCEHCRASLGELKRPDGTYYSRLERREYYDKAEKGGGGHIAKTPIHIARWAVQKFTKPVRPPSKFCWEIILSIVLYATPVANANCRI